MIHQLQRGYNCIRFEGALEDAELNGIVVGQIHAGVAAAATLLDVLQHLFGLILVAVPTGPAGELILGSAGEDQQLVPVALHQINDPPDHRLLLGIGIAQRIPIDVDMQPTGIGLVGIIPQFSRLTANTHPRHLGLMVLQGHGMCVDLKAVHQRTVMLAVNAVMLGLGVANLQDLFGVVLVFTALVDLQLHTEVAFSGTEEVEFGHEVVVMDGLAVQDVVAMLTVGNVIQIVHVVGAVIVDQLTATATVGVVVFVAPVAEGRIAGPLVIIAEDAVTAVAAEGGQAVQTLGAVDSPLKLGGLFLKQDAAAFGTGFVSHGISPFFYVFLMICRGAQALKEIIYSHCIFILQLTKVTKCGILILSGRREEIG